MKNKFVCFFSPSVRGILFTALLLMGMQSTSQAQLAIYPLLRQTGTLPAAGATSFAAAGVTAGTLAAGTSMDPNNYNGDGYRLRTNVSGSTTAWPGSPTDGFSFDIPFSPLTGRDLHISAITLYDTLPDSDVQPNTFYLVPYFQVDNAGPWRKLNGASVVSVNDPDPVGIKNFGAINETFYSGHNYVIRFYAYGAGYKSDYFRIKYLTINGAVSTAASPVTVRTDSVRATGKYTALANGTYDYNGFQYYTVQQSGFIWTSVDSTTLVGLDTLASTKTTTGNAGVLHDTLRGLSAGTTYWVKAYIVTQFGIQYGAIKRFTTDAPSLPVVTTIPVSNVLSNKATGGGVIVDSGGLAITSKGMVWNLSGGATLNSNTGKLILNGGSAAFTDFIKGLTPGTRYCYRAFATNSRGTAYGVDSCFTTAAAAPVLVAVPGLIDFGNNFFGSPAIVVSYTLTGSYLTPASGTIHVSVAGTGFQISKTSTSTGPGWGNALDIAYTGGTLPRQAIFIKFPSTAYGTFNGVITHSGGGVTAANADSVKLKGVIVASPEDVTNKGNDFWLGFGYQESMKRKTSDAAVTKMNVYITAGDQPATVVVEIPGVPSFVPQTLNIPANSVRIVTGFPSGEDVSPNMNINSPTDARLFFTGVTRRGIHVYSTNGAPVSVWQHIFANNNSAGGSMIFPTNTWNSSYTVQSYAGGTNNSYPCNSFFYVIADADGTEIEFTPSNDILDNIAGNLFTIGNATPASNIKYFKNQTYKVTLNRGEVFTALGAINGDPSSGGASLDLSGTKIKTTDCDKKIAVFCGNGRVITKVNSCSPGDGSDNLIQQMFPTVAWGTRYLTAPTKGMEYNLFRIYVKDILTVVKVDGVVAAPLINNLYYETEGNRPKLITSDKPINVTQFILAGSCKGANVGNSANGDPEMIILSPIEQAVTKTVVYSAKLQKNGATPDQPGANGSFINVIIKSEGLATFKIDGIDIASTTRVDTGSNSYANPFNPALCALSSAFKPHPQDAGYIYAKFRVKSDVVHILSSDYPFNAIAYGLGDGESYGYNAGTSIKNLSSYKISVNPDGTDSSSTVIRTCVNTPVTLKIAFPYTPSLVNRIVWQPGDARITPSNDTTGAVSGGAAVNEGSIVIEGRTYWIYKAPVPYTFAANGLYNFKVTAFGTFASDCPGEDQQTMLINVGQDVMNIAANPTCNNPIVTFTADTIPMVGTHILSWIWDFGDRSPTVSTSPISPQTHTFPTGGSTAFTVKLSTKNTVGCVSTDSLAIDFGGGLTAAFTMSDDAVCANDPVTFMDASFGSGTSGSPNDWKWDFSDGKTSTAQNPLPQSWSDPGIKTISLTVSTPIGCVKTFKDTVTVEATPVAAINPNPTFVCWGDSAAYTDASTIAIGTITGWLWTFDDITTSTEQNPKHKWPTAGSHTVTLTVTSAGGCTSTNTATHTINVNALPTAGFKYDLNCTTRTLTATDTSNGNGGTITGWNWDFGVPGATSTLQNPTYSYTASGTYTVTLSVTTANGCKSSVVASKTITIAASPVADFTLPGNTCLPNASPVFTNTTTISDGTIAQATYIWNFGDNTGDFPSPPAAVSPTHVFPANGSPAPPYTISLTAISNQGCTNTITKSYSAIFAPPVAVITPQAEVCANTAVNFSSASSTAPGSTVTGWSWNFNNEGISQDQNPSFTFTTAGIKKVILTVTTAAGCTSIPDTIEVTVNALPTAGFTDTVNCSTFSAGFTDASVANSGTINQWNWTFGDPGNSASPVQNPTFVYPAEGDYAVKLSVKTDKGCTSATAATQTVHINARPVPDFTLPGNTCLPNANALFTNTTAISDGSIGTVTYTWDFGDNTGMVPSPPNSPTHPYTAAGNYTVTLTATSVNGCTKSISKLYDKVFVQPVAVITAPAGVCLGNAANFSSSSSTAAASSVTGWSWNFGDIVPPGPGTSTDQNPTYTYAGSGPMTVTLTVTSAAGCTSAITSNQINVNLSPVAAFTYSAIRCKDSVVTFNDASVSNATGGITERTWNFNPGTSTDQDPTHVFTSAQSYTVSLSVKNANGCVSASAYTTQVVINPNPVSNFKVSDICIPAGLAQFTDQSTISSGQVRSWDWNFGDGSGISSLQNPTYTYTNGAVYQVTLRVTSDSSCSASVTTPVTAYNTPTASFEVSNPTNLCSNLSVSIVNKSVVTGFGTVDKIEIFWDYVNNPSQKTTVNAPAPDAAFSNQYPEFGNQPTKSYRVLVRAYSGSGCSADFYTDITLLASPKVQFTQPAPVCQEASAYSLTTASEIYGLPGSGAYSGAGISSSPSFSPSAAGAGTHTIRYTYTTTTGGCIDTAEQKLLVNPTPVIDFGTSTINVLEGDVMKLEPEISHGATYLWTPSTYLNNPTSPTPSGIPTADITYQLRVTSDKGCVDSARVAVKVVRQYVIPNTFTPNIDGNHDTWVIENLPYYPDVRVRVFNRSGQVVFESFGYNTAWDGKYKGADLPFGTYYYVIETGGGRKPRTGYVTIIR